MLLSRSLLSLPPLALALTNPTIATPTATLTTNPENCCVDLHSKTFHRTFITKWLSFWNGNMTLLNDLASPDMVMYQDRVPSPTGNGSSIIPINSSQGLAQGMAYALASFENYHFDLVGWASMQSHIAVRWTLNGILGKAAPVSSTIGNKVAINGTDFIFLDECTGLIKRYDLAMDSIQKYHELGFTAVPVQSW